MATQPHSDRSGQSGAEERDSELTQQDSPQQSATDATEEFAPLADGYVYVTDGDDTAAQAAEDDSLSHQLLRNGSFVEKRSFKDVIEDHNYNRAVEREQKQEEKEQQREAEIIAGIQAMRAGRARAAERDRLGLPPEEPEEEKKKKPFLIGGLTLAGLALAGGTLAFALGGGSNDKDQEPVAVPETSTSASASESSKPKPSAPKPSFNSKAPEVNFVESSEAPVTPGEVEYVQEAPAEEVVPETTEVPAPVEEAPTAPAPTADKPVETKAPEKTSEPTPEPTSEAPEKTQEPTPDATSEPPTEPTTQAPVSTPAAAPATEAYSAPAAASQPVGGAQQRSAVTGTQTGGAAPTANQPAAGASGTATR